METFIILMAAVAMIFAAVSAPYILKWRRKRPEAPKQKATGLLIIALCCLALSAASSLLIFSDVI